MDWTKMKKRTDEVVVVLTGLNTIYNLIIIRIQNL